MNFETVYQFLSHFSAFSVLVPILLCFKFYKHFNLVSKLLLLYLLVSLITEALQTYLNIRKSSTTLPLDIFSIVEFSLIVSIFFLALNPMPYVKKILFSLMFIGLVLFIYGWINSNLLLFNSYYTLLLFALALLFIFKEDKELNIPNLLDNYFYWYNIGFLMFFGTCFFLMVFDDFIVHADKTIARLLWCIQLFNNLIFYTVLSIGIWKTRLT